MHQFGWLSKRGGEGVGGGGGGGVGEGVIFKICFRKREVPRKGGFQPWRKLCWWMLLPVWKSSMMDICRPSLLDQTKNKGWFLLKRFVDLVRVCYLHIISRNHYNTLLLLNLQKTKTCPKTLQQRLFVLILGFWQCRQVSVLYLMSILMMFK